MNKNRNKPPLRINLTLENTFWSVPEKVNNLLEEVFCSINTYSKEDLQLEMSLWFADMTLQNEDISTSIKEEIAERKVELNITMQKALDYLLSEIVREENPFLNFDRIWISEFHLHGNSTDLTKILSERVGIRLNCTLKNCGYLFQTMFLLTLRKDGEHWEAELDYDEDIDYSTTFLDFDVGI